MAWKKGQSGNPRGRRPDPAELVEVQALAKKHTKEAIERLAFWMREENPKASVSAAMALLDRAHGKPSQSIDIEAAVTNYAAQPIPVEQRDVDSVASAAGPATNGHSPQPN